MGHGKETPRQKMIGMMYLVLTAMLALNVSKDILNAFILVDEGLGKSNEILYKRNERMYTEFNKQAAINPAKAGKWRDKAEEVKAKAQRLINFIQECKVDIIKAADGVDAPALHEGDKIHGMLINSKDNTDAPAQIMIGATRNGKGFQIKDSIVALREFCISLIDLNQDTFLLRSLEKGLDTSDPPVLEGQTHTWESEHFEHLPMVGVLTIMSNLQGSIRNAEAEMVNFLYSQITEGELNFNKIEATVIPNSNYVLKGSSYEAKIFLAAMDSTQDPRILIGDALDSTKQADGTYSYTVKGRVDSVPVKEGKGILSRPGNSANNYKYAGVIQIKSPDGRVISRPFREEYQVAEAGIVVSPTKMNVFYLGLENPVDVSVPGIPKDKIDIRVNNGNVKKSKDGYFIVPATRGECKLFVTATIDGKKKEMGFKEFRIKTVPDPIAKVGGVASGSIKKTVLAAQKVVIAELPDFLFDLKFDVVAFNIYTVQKGFVKEALSKSSQITEEQREILKGLGTKQKVFFESIKVRKPGNQIVEVGAISLTVD